jgi:hypothetical protein
MFSRGRFSAAQPASQISEKSGHTGPSRDITIMEEGTQAGTGFTWPRQCTASPSGTSTLC